MSLEPRLNLVTLGVVDLEKQRAFYRDVLGWTPAQASNEHVAFFQLGGVVLSLFPRASLAEDAHLTDGARSSFSGVTLAQNVPARDDVDRVLGALAKKGVKILKPAEDAFWGGRSGYFADPEGNAWEVAWNPAFPLTAEGIVRLS